MDWTHPSQPNDAIVKWHRRPVCDRAGLQQAVAEQAVALTDFKS